jgi:hypothetical protein
MLVENTASSNLALSKLSSLRNILKDQFEHYNLSYSGYHFDTHSQLFYVASHTGNFKPLYAINLIKHPRLTRMLRKHPHYPCYDCKIPIDSSSCQLSLTDLIAELKTFESRVSVYQKAKVKIDQEINHLLMIHQGNEVTPIYLGQKPFYTRKRYCHRYTNQINLSGVRYFMDVYSYKRRYQSTEKEKLYHLDAYELLKSHRTWSNIKGHHAPVLDIPDLQHCYFIGGVVNTPILAFRCKRNHALKGKIYYLDLQTNQLTAKLTEAREMAQLYGQHLQLDTNKRN